MARRANFLYGAVAVLAVIAVILLVRVVTMGSGAGAAGSAAPSASAVAAASASDTVASASPSPGPSTSLAPTPSPSPTPSPTPTATPSPTPTETPTPEETLDPRVAYAAFLAHLDDARTQASDLSQRLLASAEAGDEAPARDTAVQMLAFADEQRDWLAANPPAGCYKKAHIAANDMVEAYATVADLAIEWADADKGFDKLTALAKLGVAGDDARTTLDALVKALGKTTCRT